jgi:NADH dehydrogenase [ubiquinone] 1 alpha subcomplex assembly factor 7
VTAYDPNARRKTPLAEKLKARIRRDGPISVGEFMDACLNDSEHGYYKRMKAIGIAGDFITSPEISQVFGELIGLWSVGVWQQMGAPNRFNLIELGAGRGTLMRDALRAARIVPGFLAAAEVTLVDINPVLREAQKEALAKVARAGAQISFYDSLSDEFLQMARCDPVILIANELLDVCPVEQFVKSEGGWQTRCVGLDQVGNFQFLSQKADERCAPVATPSCRNLDERFPQAETGGIFTQADYGYVERILTPLGQVAALFIDYGHTHPQIGDTLQAIRSHAYEHPLTSPGEADLTAQVDFSAFVEQIASSDVMAVDGPLTQAEFFGRLGIIERASRLMAANPQEAAGIEAGVSRLMSPQGMGARFKAIGVRSKGLPPLPGFG